MPLRLTLHAQSSIPIEVTGLVPDAVRDMTLAKIERLPVFHGNGQLPLAELFEVRGDAADERIEFDGDMAGVHHIGARMRSGAIHVTGSAGRHLGSQMTGGEITVAGDAADWAARKCTTGSYAFAEMPGIMPEPPIPAAKRA